MIASLDGYSCAGSKGGYIYFAKKVSTEIQDVVVNTPTDGEVKLYVLMDNGSIADSEMKNLVLAACSADSARPLTDHVSVEDPEVVSYSIDLTYYIPSNSSQSAADIETAVNEAVEEYIAWQCGKLGRDINPTELIYKVRAAGAKRVVINSPVFTVLRDGETFNTVAESVPQIATSSPSTTITNGGFEDE